MRLPYVRLLGAGLVVVLAALPAAVTNARAAPPGWMLVQSAATTSPAGVQTGVAVTCPEGLVALGGGVTITSTALGETINSSFPQVSGGIATGWVGHVNNASGAASQFTVYAVCAHAPRNYSIQSASAINPLGAQTASTVQCPIGPNGTQLKALSGGASGDLSSPGQNVNSSYPPNTHSWTVRMNNAADANSSFTAYVACGTRTAYTRVVSGVARDSPGTVAGWWLGCPSGQVEVGGGGLANSTSTTIDMTADGPYTGSPYPYQWYVSEENTSPTATTLRGYIVCVG
jgi:hypothetical protein